MTKNQSSSYDIILHHKYNVLSTTMYIQSDFFLNYMYNTECSMSYTNDNTLSTLSLLLLDIYGKCRTMNPSTNTSATSTGNIQGWSQKI